MDLLKQSPNKSSVTHLGIFFTEQFFWATPKRDGFDGLKRIAESAFWSDTRMR